MNTKLKFDNIVNISFDDREFDVYVKATGNYYYQPCVMYFKDGTGQPEEEEFEVDEIEITRVYEPSTQKNTTEFDNNAYFEEAVSDALYTEWENGSEDWIYPEEPEPEPDEPEEW